MSRGMRAEALLTPAALAKLTATLAPRRDATRVVGAAAVMNKTEARYAQRLNVTYPGQWRFGAIKLRLTNGRWYTPDFCVFSREAGEVVFHEIKGGFIREDSVVKFDFAVREYPEYSFLMFQWKHGKWTCVRASNPLINEALSVLKDYEL